MRRWKYALLIVVALPLLSVACLGSYRYGDRTHAIRSFSETIDADTTFTGQTAAYRELLGAIGPAAQDTLFDLFAPTPRTHMLNHESGLYLYETEGERGIAECKNYFNGSCYHGFVEALLADRGFGALESVIETCRDGRVLEQARECSHGVGHAFLITVGYARLPDAVALCRSAFASSTVAIGDCDDGVFMENNFGGFSVPPDNRWFLASDPQFPCNEDGILSDDIAHDSCWFMQSQSTLSAERYPRFEGSFEKVVAYCLTIADAGDRRTCDQGLARQIQARAGSDLDAIISGCSLSYPGSPETCYSDAAESAYGFGAEQTGIALCERSGPHSDECFEALYARISSTAYHTLRERLRACERVGDRIRIAVCVAYAHEHSSS